MEGTIGEIRLFSGSFAPTSWLMCQGQVLQITQHTALFGIIGIKFGGDGTQTFQLPDLRGRVPAAPNAVATPQLPAIAVTQLLGSTTNTLTAANIPIHSHGVYVNNNPAPGTLNSPAGNFISSGPVVNGVAVNTRFAFAKSTNTDENTMNAQAVLVAGAGTPYSNMMPTTALNYIICVNGIYPMRN